MNNKLMETDRRKKSDGEATAIVKMLAKIQATALLFIITLVIFFLSLASCKKDDVIQTNTNTNPLVGEWYEVGSTENIGTKVTFTETKVTAYKYAQYFNDPNYSDSLVVYMIYDNSEYTIIAVDTIAFQHYPMLPEINDTAHRVVYAFKTKDTLWIDRFQVSGLVGYPPFVAPILLYRSQYEK